MMNELQYYLAQITDLWQYKIAAGITIGAIATLFGIDATMLICISALMFTDLFAGIVVAWKTNTFETRKLSRGVAKFFAYYLSMLLVNIVNTYASASLGITFPIQNLYVTYLIATEAISVMNHCSTLGMPFPPLFSKIIKRYHSRVEDAVDNIVTDDKARVHNDR